MKESEAVNPKPSPITIEQRRAWFESAKAATEAPPEEWIDRIRAGKPSSITTKTSGQFFAICDLEKEGVLRIASMKQGKTNGEWNLTLYYPPLEQPDLI